MIYGNGLIMGGRSSGMLQGCSRDAPGMLEGCWGDE